MLNFFYYHLSYQKISNYLAEWQIRLIINLSVWVVIVGCIAWYLPSTYTSLLLGAFVGGSTIIIINAFQEYDLKVFFEGLITEEDAIKKAVAGMRILDYLKAPNTKWDFAAQAYINYHYTLCKSEMCPITKLVENSNDKRVELDILHSFQYVILRRLKKGIIENPDKLEYRLFTIGYIISNANSWILAVELIKQGEQLTLNSYKRYKLYCYW